MRHFISVINLEFVGAFFKCPYALTKTSDYLGVSLKFFRSFLDCRPYLPNSALYDIFDNLLLNDRN